MQILPLVGIIELLTERTLPFILCNSGHLSCCKMLVSHVLSLLLSSECLSVHNPFLFRLGFSLGSRLPSLSNSEWASSGICKTDTETPAGSPPLTRPASSLRRADSTGQQATGHVGEHNTTQHCKARCSSLTLITTIFHRHMKYDVNLKSGTASQNFRNAC